MGVYDVIWSLGGFVTNVAEGFASIILSLYGLLSTVVNIVTVTVSILPPAWGAVILAGMSVVVVYTVHSFVKHIQLMGWKI